MAHDEQDKLVILEVEAQWPAWFERIEENEPGAVLAQQPDESLALFADRVAAEVGRRSPSKLALALIACSERADDAALAARRKMARAILAAMADGGHGAVVFTESQRQSGGCRQALTTLATDLSLEWEDSGLSVSVRFGQPSRPPQMSSDTALVV